MRQTVHCIVYADVATTSPLLRDAFRETAHLVEDGIECLDGHAIAISPATDEAQERTRIVFAVRRPGVGALRAAGALVQLLRAHGVRCASATEPATA